MNTTTPTSLVAGRSTLPAPQNRIYLWRVSSTEKLLNLRILAESHTQAERIFSRCYPGLQAVANGRFAI